MQRWADALVSVEYLKQWLEAHDLCNRFVLFPPGTKGRR